MQRRLQYSSFPPLPRPPEVMWPKPRGRGRLMHSRMHSLSSSSQSRWGLIASTIGRAGWEACGKDVKCGSSTSVASCHACVTLPSGNSRMRSTYSVSSAAPEGAILRVVLQEASRTPSIEAMSLFGVVPIRMLQLLSHPHSYGGQGVIWTCHLPWMHTAPMPQQLVPQNTPSGSHGSPCSNCPVHAVHTGAAQLHAGGGGGGST